MIPGLEGLIESDQAVPADRLRDYLEVLESAAEAREAAAARLRAQIRETSTRHPSVFSPGPVAALDNVASVNNTNKDSNNSNDSNKIESDAEVEGAGKTEDGGGAVVEGAHGGAAPGADVVADVGKSEKEGSDVKKGGKGKGVVGLAGKILRNVLHMAPSTEQPHEDGGKEAGGDAGVGVGSSSSPTTPNAIAADGKVAEGVDAVKGGEDGDGPAGSGEVAVDKTAAVEVSVEGVVVGM